MGGEFPPLPMNLLVLMNLSIEGVLVGSMKQQGEVLKIVEENPVRDITHSSAQRMQVYLLANF